MGALRRLRIAGRRFAAPLRSERGETPALLNVQRSSYKEQRVNALVPEAEEGRGKLRKAAGRRTQP